MQEIRNSLKWADGKAIKNEIDLQLFDLLGQKTDKDSTLPENHKMKVDKDERKQLNGMSIYNNTF